jgi:hypothetical protein
LPPDHPKVGRTICRIAYVERQKKRWNDAERHFLEGISDLESALGPGADDHLDRAIELRRSVRPEDDGQLLYLQAIRQVRSNGSAARELLRRALDQDYPPYRVDLDVDLAPLADDSTIQAVLKREQGR